MSLNVMPKRGYIGRPWEIVEPPVQQRGYLWLVNAHQSGGAHLRQSPALQNPADMTGELSLGQFLFRLGETKICKHIAAAGRYRDTSCGRDARTPRVTKGK